ncbi:hypothetical protein GIB67_001905 [Kingdonia uniflora]|uniref:Uncharacterized protein n=1 Tax=Kingdonia uniflora TaxID=39325 RepID=A0A7J7LED4_9MAGN|nr:hypothetical protein GIB67_001905 [Kingdonia uniflora]
MKKDRTVLTEELTVMLLFILVFVSFETTSLAQTLAIKLLIEQPSAHKELNDEHEEIIRTRENSESSVTWKEYKSMAFTLQVNF